MVMHTKLEVHLQYLQFLFFFLTFAKEGGELLVSYTYHFVRRESPTQYMENVWKWCGYG